MMNSFHVTPMEAIGEHDLSVGCARRPGRKKIMVDRVFDKVAWPSRRHGGVL